MGPLQSTLLGFGVFQLLAKRFDFAKNFSAFENVVLQTIAISTATMPLAGGTCVWCALRMNDASV